MGFWNSIESLRGLSHSLMWATGVFGVLAALATGCRYYVDRRVSALSAVLQKAEAERRDKAQADREAEVRNQLAAADRVAREADEQARLAAAAAEQLRRAQEPRVSVFRVHKASFLRALGGDPGATPVMLESPMGNAEARELAQELKQLLLSRGWQADGSQSILTGAPKGVLVFGDPASPDRRRIVEALSATGFAPEVRDTPKQVNIRVLVAQKP